MVGLLFSGCENIENVQTEQVSNILQQKNVFRIERSQNESGEISLSYVFPINSEFLQQDFQSNEINVWKFYLATYVNALAKANKENEIQGVVVGGCEYFSRTDGFGFSITFDDIETQKKFFKIESDEPDKPSSTKSSGIFIKKIEIETNFPISSKDSADNIMQICTLALDAWAKNNNIESDKKEKFSNYIKQADFVYDFSSSNNKLKSQYMYSDENVHNLFIMNVQEIENGDKIKFWLTTPNRPMWYISALIFVLLFVGLMLIKPYLKRKKKV